MVAAGVRRTQVERRNRSEEALLDAAADLIAERGVERASLAGIGERAGVSRGLSTHHFGTKNALVARLAQRAQDRLQSSTTASFRDHARPAGEQQGLEMVRLMVRAYLHHFENPTSDERALIVMWGSTFPSNSSVEGMVEAERRGYDGLSELIAFGQRDGSIRKDADPAATAVLLLGLIRGTAALMLTDSAVTDMRSVLKACDEWVTSALAPPPTS